ncbi:MAG TPA: HAD family hydrolase [Actinomycetes bacterium]|jgi:phosphoglycolate phosphatase-like HAD superfamily hydrolase|nr:HAD family hydrolase [Actinomycetes bacterium]
MAHMDGAPRHTDSGTRHLVWDWNGTLFDDQVAVVAAVNDALSLLGVPPIDADRYRSHFTRPVQRFYEQVVGRAVSADEWQALDEAYHDGYQARLERLALASDARAALAAAEAAGLPQSLLSMWRHQDLVALVERLGIDHFFVRVDGLRRPGGGGKAEHLVAHLAALELAPQTVVLVGDSLDDLAAARAVGARCVLYDGGSHHRHALEATGVPVVDTLTAALAAADPSSI